MTTTPDILAAMLDGEAQTARSIAAGHAFRRAAALVREHLGRTPVPLPERPWPPINSHPGLVAARVARRTGTFGGALVVVVSRTDGTWSTHIWGETPAHRLMAGAMADACLDGLSVNDTPDWLIARLAQGELQ